MFRSEIYLWLIFCGPLLFGNSDLKADKTTNDNYYGSWGSDQCWVGGTAPNFTNLPSPVDENYTIQGYINVGSASSSQDLTFKVNKDTWTITIVDTLVVHGNVDFANSSMNLTIGNGGLFIILGDLDMNNKIDISSNGGLVVQGNFNKSGGQGSYTGSGNVYAGSYSGDASNLVPDSNENDAGSDLQNDLPDIFDFLQNNGNTPLPVELLFFRADVLKESISVTWSTASELHNDYFTLERSGNGKHFETIAKVYGNGTVNTISNYRFSDKHPFLGLSFYRLSQTDFDGVKEVFPIISILFSPAKDNFAIGPNPIKSSYFRIKASGKGKNKRLLLRIVDLHGRILEEAYLLTDNYGNLDLEIHLENQLRKGSYLFELISENQKEIVKVVRE